MFKKIILASVAVAFVSAAASAAPKPKEEETAPNCNLATVMTSFTGYLGCQGAFTGNINGGATELAQLSGFGGNWAGVWQMAGKSDEGNDGWFGGDLYTDGGVDYIDFEGALTGKFVIGVKQASYYSFYLYQWDGISTVPLDWKGTAPKQPGYSHINLYRQSGGEICTNGGCNEIPEPTSFGLVAAGIAGLGIMIRRRRRSV